MIWAIFLLVSRSSETYIVRQGTLTQEDEARSPLLWKSSFLSFPRPT